MSIFSRIANALRPGRLERDLEDEQRFHIEARARDLVARGLPQADAECAARRQFGNPLLLRESSRDARLLPWLESLVRDARYGFRMLRKDAVVTAAAVLSLALAIGACSAAFTLIDALILRPLPVRDPHSLIYLAHAPDGPLDRETEDFSYPLFPGLREAAREHANLFAMSQQSLADATFQGDAPERLRTQYVSGDAFPLLGLSPALGRLLGPDDDRRPGDRPVAVLSFALWMRRFNGDPKVLGRWLAIGEKRLQVVGVAPKSFTGMEPGIRTDVWMPLMMFHPEGFTNSGWTWLRIFGRLQAGATPERVRQVLDGIAGEYRRQHPRDYFPARLLVRSAANGPSRLRRDFERPLWILGIVAGLVLLIAASNVANLFVARAAARSREFALRISIGAGRERLIQQALIESGLLVAAACLLGLAFARAAAPAMVTLLQPQESAAWLDLRLDFRVLSFVAGLGAIATVAFGLAPAFRAATLPADRRSAMTSRGLRPVLCAQVGLSFIVLFVGGLLLVSFHNLTTVDLGFSQHHLVLFSVEAKSIPAVLEHVRALPGVQAAGASGWALFNHSRWTSTVRGRGAGVAHVLAVSPGFFDAMGIRLVSGRDFNGHDTQTSAVVNEAFVRAYLGDRRTFERSQEHGFVPIDVIGVVRSAKYLDLRAPAPPTMYLPLTEKDEVNIAVRTAADPRYLARALSAELERFDPSVKVQRFVLQSELIDGQIIPERLLALLSAFFTAVALALAAIGLYGVLSYSVVRRTREIGIRVALGARQIAVVRLVIAEVALVAIVGLAAGAAGALTLSRFVAKLLYEVKPTDPAALALPLTCLLIACALAAIAPAVRAARVDPTVALRCE